MFNLNGLYQIQCILVEVRFLLTHAHGLVSSSLEAVVAETAITSLCIDTLSVTAYIRYLLTFITVCEEETQMLTYYKAATNMYHKFKYFSVTS